MGKGAPGPSPGEELGLGLGNSLLAQRRAQVDLGDDLARRALAVVRVDAGALILLLGALRRATVRRAVVFSSSFVPLLAAPHTIR